MLYLSNDPQHMFYVPTILHLTISLITIVLTVLRIIVKWYCVCTECAICVVLQAMDHIASGIEDIIGRFGRHNLRVSIVCSVY